MGQGTESCGGYEIHYDPLEEGLEKGLWEMANGSSISVSDMTIRHLKNTIRHCRNKARTASFSCDADTYHDWINVLEDELYNKTCDNLRSLNDNESKITKKIKKSKTLTKINGIIKPTQQKMKCFCGNEYVAKKADLKRGWGKSCSKSCAAIRREFGRPAGIKIS
jgi:hypothetical protein